MSSPSITNRRKGSGAQSTNYAVGLIRDADPLLVVSTLIGFVLRIATIGSQSLWYDELSTRAVLEGSFLGLLTRARALEGTPPLYFAVQDLWCRLFGYSDGPLRSLSATVGALTVLVMFATARALQLSRRMARCVAILIAVNPFLIWYSQEARAYSLLVFLLALSMLALARAKERGTSADFWFFGVTSGLAMMTHYFAVFFIIPEVAILLASSHRLSRRVWKGFAPLVAVLPPLALLALDQRSRNLQTWVKNWPLSFRLRTAAENLLVGPASPRPWLWIPVAIIFGVGCLLAVTARSPSANRTAFGLLALALFVVSVPALFTLSEYDYFLDRNVIGALLPLTLLIAIGLGSERFRFFGSGAMVALVAISMTAVIASMRDPELQRASWRTLAGSISQDVGDKVIVMNKGGIQATALTHYLPPGRQLTKDRRVRTSQLLFIGVPRISKGCTWWVGRPCSLLYMTDRPQVSLPRSFHVTKRQRVGLFSITYMKSSSLESVDARSLVTQTDLPNAFVFWLPQPR